MRKLRIVPRIAAALLLAAAAREGLAQEIPQETSFSVTGRYTAQRKPRVVVGHCFRLEVGPFQLFGQP